MSKRRFFLSGFLKSVIFVVYVLALTSCAPLETIKGPDADFEGRLRTDIDGAAKEPVSFVDISADDFAIMESPAVLKKYRDVEVSMSVKDLSLSQAMALLFSEYGIDHFLSETEAGKAGKGGNISLIYKGTLQHLLDTLSMQYGYYFSEENGVIRLSDERTYMFSIPSMVSEALFQKATETTAASADTAQPANASVAASTGAAATSTTGAASTSDQAGDFMATLKNMGAKDVIIDKMNSLVSFKCNSSSLTGIKAYLRKVRDNIAIISLDVLVAEVELNDGYSRGIDWSVFYANSNNVSNREEGSFGFPQGLADDLNPASLGFGLIDSHWNLSAVLSFLETQGKTEILQKPTLTVLNGNRAFLRAGKEIPYVDEIKITPTQVGTALTFLQEVTFKNLLEGIEIEILPRLREDLITLSLRGVITGFIEFRKMETGGGASSGTVEKPVTTTRDVQSITALRAGEILKIGGIIVGRDQRNSKGFPGSKVSGLTEFLFSTREDTKSRSEIVILVKPRVIRFKEKT
jgi:type II secretory pathway component GspD/PulD (secretin)